MLGDLPTPAEALKPHHERMLGFIDANELITDRDCAGLVDRAKAARALDFKKLIELGHIERKGRGEGDVLRPQLIYP